MARTIVSGGLVVTPSGATACDVVIEQGRFTGLLEGSSGIDAYERIDATGLVVLPGGIDGHTHFLQDDPENTDAELAAPHPEEFDGFTNGGRGASAGGATTLVERPTAGPSTRTGGLRPRKID